MQSSRKENLTIFLMLTVLGVSLIYNAFSIPPGSSLGLGADIMPKIIGVLILLCGLGFLFQGLRTPKGTQEKTKFDFGLLFRFGIALGFLLIYVILLKSVGFVIMSALYIFAQSQLMVPSHKRNYLISAVLAVVASVVIYLIFSKGLDMVLPAGILDGIL